MEETKVSKREWVKTAAIIFLAILLVLTFFSNTIMNATLPEVAAQQIEGGTIWLTPGLKDRFIPVDQGETREIRIL